MASFKVVARTVGAVLVGLAGVTYVMTANYYGAPAWLAWTVGIVMTLCLGINFGVWGLPKAK